VCNQIRPELPRSFISYWALAEFDFELTASPACPLLVRDDDYTCVGRATIFKGRHHRDHVTSVTSVVSAHHPAVVIPVPLVHHRHPVGGGREVVR